MDARRRSERGTREVPGKEDCPSGSDEGRSRRVNRMGLALLCDLPPSSYVRIGRWDFFWPRKRLRFDGAAESRTLSKLSEYLSEPRKAEFHFGKWVQFSGIPPPPRSIGMMDLAETLKIICGAQQLRGKILSRKDLGPVDRFLFTLLSRWR